MVNLTSRLQSIPTIFRAILTGFLTILAIRVFYPIADYVLDLFTKGTMLYYSANLGYWLIVLFVTWFLLWVQLFKVEGGNR